MIWRTQYNSIFLLALTASCGADDGDSRLAKAIAGLDRPHRESRRTKIAEGGADINPANAPNSTGQADESTGRSVGSAANKQGREGAGESSEQGGIENFGKVSPAESLPQPIDPADPAVDSDGPANGETTDRWLTEINSVRENLRPCGTSMMPAVTPLAWNGQLATAAQRQAKDMRTNKNFDHTGSDGSSPSDRISASGYAYTASSEIIAFGFVSLKPILALWTANPTHCSNIMNGSFTEMGLARSGIYWTLVLAKPKS